MKVLHWIIATITGAILALLIPAMLAGPINDYFRNDRIVGSMEIGPAADRPLPPQPKQEGKTAEEILAQVRQDLQNLSPSTGAAFANLTLENNSDKVVSNIRLKFNGYRADVLLDRDGDDGDVFIKNVDEVSVPDMKQGDTLKYKLWLNSNSPEDIADNLKTFSSSGAIRMRFSWPETMSVLPETGFDKFTDDWGEVLGSILMILLIVILGGMTFTYEDLIKKMLKDTAVYEIHRKRFEADPKKYNPFAPAEADEPKSAELPSRPDLDTPARGENSD